MRSSVSPSSPLARATRRFATICVCVFSAIASQAARGAAVFLVGQDEPVYGYLVSADDTKVVLDVPQPDGKLSRTQYLRDQVEDLLVTVSPERLESLSPDDPLSYLQYAEELSIKKQDPEARDAARRLFLIAGSLSPQTHGRQAALGLANVTVDKGEARKALALASLIAPSGPVAETVVAAPAAPKIDANRAGALIRGFQAYRSGDVATAKRAFSDAKNIDLLSKLDPPVPLERLNESLKRTKFVPDYEVLAAIVPLERSLRSNGTLGSMGSETSENPFSEANRLPVAWPTWNNVTPFDPAESVFRDGRWQRP